MNPIPIDVAAEWHPTKNGTLKPEDFSAGSGKKVWWLGKACAHAWPAVINNRVKGSGCAVCSGRLLLKGFNDLATRYPEIAAEWDTLKNGVGSDDVISGGNKQYAFLCSAHGHPWDANLGTRVSQNTGCPFCTNRKLLVGFNDLASRFPEIAAEWHPTKNGDLKPENVLFGSNKKVFWLCALGHDWDTTIAHRTNDKEQTGCPTCNGRRVKENFNDLATTHPEIAAEWHPTKNGDLKPTEISQGSHQIIVWIDSLGHDWPSTVYDRVRGQGCPVCSNNEVRAGINDLATHYAAVAAEWHPTKNGDLKPTEVTPGSNREVYWIGACGHEYSSSVHSRVRGHGCTLCAGKVVVSGINDLATKHPEIAAEWHPTLNGELKPEQFSPGSNTQIWWTCVKGHQPWITKINHRVYSKSNCPSCTSVVSKAEKELAEYIESLGFTIDASNRSVLKNQEIDIYIPARKLGIEFNGLYWHSEARGKGKSYHYNKWQEAKAAGVQLIQIWEDDWKRDPEVIKNLVAHKLGVSKQVKIAARKTKVSLLSKKEAAVFFTANHIQGYASGSYYVGLQYENETVAVLVVKKESNGDFNIIRYATSANVMGGFTKLIAHIEREYNPSKFVTFSDHTVSDGGLYLNNDFTADKEIAPDYMYIVDGERKHKFGYRLNRFKTDPELLWEESLSERELAELNGIERIWDAGKTRWVKAVS